MKLRIRPRQTELGAGSRALLEVSGKLTIFADTMSGSIQDKVLARLRAKGRGTVCVPADFLDLGSRAAVEQALSRLVRAGALRRLVRGVYDFPKIHTRLGPLSPALPQVARAIARSTGSQLQVSGAQAANQLGLSTQVPARVVYLTDGPSRTVQVGSRAIEFRHAAPRSLAGAGTPAGVVMQALRHIGRGSLTPDVVAHVRRLVRDDDRRSVAKHLSSAPAWMRPALRTIAEPADRASAA